MKLTVINGSPRGNGSNTKIILSYFNRGFLKSEKNSVDLFYLKSTRDPRKQREIFMNAENLMIAFPLYTDSMPGLVKAFFENLEPLKGEKIELKVGFIIQSGFPEAYQSHFLELYLEKLVRRLGCNYLGTIIKGNVEGVQVKPLWMVKGYLKKFEKLGEIFGREKNFDQKITHQLAKPYKLNGFILFLLRLIKKMGLMNMYWDKMLKDNNAFARRDEKPYQEKIKTENI